MDMITLSIPSWLVYSLVGFFTASVLWAIAFVLVARFGMRVRRPSADATKQDYRNN